MHSNLFMFNNLGRGSEAGVLEAQGACRLALQSRRVHEVKCHLHEKRLKEAVHSRSVHELGRVSLYSFIFFLVAQHVLE
jgi:hypothetical protein